jgi:hypothetical protein
MSEIAIAAAVIGGATSAAGSIMRGRAEAGSAQFQQQQLQVQEERYRTAASEKEAQRRRDLTSSLETIQAVRAGRGVGEGSPTGMAILQNAIDSGERDISIERANFLTSADTARRASIMAGQKASNSLLSGYFGAGESLASAGFRVANIYNGTTVPSRSLGNSSIGDPTRLGALY